MDIRSEENFCEISMQVPWGTLAGRWYGNQLQRPIIALHGWLDNCGSFAKLAPLITPHASLLCIDLPGHGHSSHLPPGVLYADIEFVRIILRLMDKYNWEKVSLMGHSFGGSICFHFAAFYPDRVDMLIGIDTIKNKHFEPQVLIKMLDHSMKRALIANERISNTQHSTINEPPSYSYDKCVNLLYKGANESINLENCKYILNRNISRSTKDPNKFYFSCDGRMKYMIQYNANDELAKEMALRICKTAIPYSVIKGGATQSPSALDKTLNGLFIENNTNFELHEIANATHHLHLNNPEPVAELIIQFLRKYRPIERIQEEVQKILYVKSNL